MKVKIKNKIEEKEAPPFEAIINNDKLTVEPILDFFGKYIPEKELTGEKPEIVIDLPTLNSTDALQEFCNEISEELFSTLKAYYKL